jgi:hypothetical protein
MCVCIVHRCQQCVSLFDVDPVAMLDKNSEGRRTLTKLTLAFSHMMYELKAFFPDGTYAADSFAIVKVDAANWWRRYFDGRFVDLFIYRVFIYNVDRGVDCVNKNTCLYVCIWQSIYSSII